jgi:hypothetical protein
MRFKVPVLDTGYRQSVDGTADLVPTVIESLPQPLHCGWLIFYCFLEHIKYIENATNARRRRQLMLCTRRIIVDCGRSAHNDTAVNIGADYQRELRRTASSPPRVHLFWIVMRPLLNPPDSPPSRPDGTSLGTTEPFDRDPTGLATKA